MTAFTVVARCAHGHPLVIRNAPMDDDGDPFPTLYWLTCPDHVKAISRLEAEGWIKRLADEAVVDPDLRISLRRAHEAYARERGRLHPGAEAWGGVAGSRSGVKCLHAHYAYFLAGGADPIGRWVARRLQEGEPIHYEKPGRRLAAVDLGTNSIRLLVARYSYGELTDLARDTVITRIGQGVDRSGRLAPDALERTLTVLERYCRRARALGAERVRVSATSAVRDAANREELAEAVERLSGEPLEVLTGEDEARATFVGAVRGLVAPGPFLVIDIGGGSTEFVVGDLEPGPSVSMQVGSVRLTERFVETDPPSFEELEAVDNAVTEALSETEDRIPVMDAKTLVAVAGTSTTVQAIALGLAEYDPDRLHRSMLSREDAEHVFRLLADMTVEERHVLGPMIPGREDVIVAGAAILVGAMRRWGFTEALVSETDILDGLVYRLAEEPEPEP
jgi:exopolyphosphatase / guanosine-5'-triphosphate,3'-diphosphate pyrophosphatase